MSDGEFQQESKLRLQASQSEGVKGGGDGPSRRGGQGTSPEGEIAEPLCRAPLIHPGKEPLNRMWSLLRKGRIKYGSSTSHGSLTSEQCEGIPGQEKPQLQSLFLL